MKNVLFVIDNLGAGGAQNQMTLISTKLKEIGYNVAVFTYYHNDFFLQRLTDNQINYYCSNKTNKIGLNVILELYRVVIEGKYNMIISFLDTPNFYSAIIKRILGEKLKLVISYRSMTEFSRISIFKYLLLRWTNSNADIIVTNSHHERLNWHSREGVKNKEKWKTIYNGVEDLGYLTNRLRKNKLICVGSLSKGKNGLLIIKAMAYLKSNNELNFKFHWIGRKISVKKGSSELANKMENLLKEYNLEDYWIWEGQQLITKSHYIDCDALVLPSKIEGFPNVVCEAQMAGCPVLISNILDHPLLIKDDVNGYTFDPNDHISLAKKIKYFYSLSNDDYINMCKMSRTVAEKNYSIHTLVENYKRLI